MASSATTPVRLSKSKIAAFEHCPKRLWMQVHQREERQFDEATLTRFQFGHDVGGRAQFLEPDGVLVDTGMDMDAAISRTRDLIEATERRPIFEATFVHDNVLVRVDILRPSDGGWEAIEVKATSRVGGHHLRDLGTQVWVMRQSGLRILRATIRHLRRHPNWRAPDISGVQFCDTDVTGPIERFVASRAAVVKRAAETVLQPAPAIPIGMHCYRPLACEFRDYCRRQAGLQVESRSPVTPHRKGHP